MASFVLELKWFKQVSAQAAREEHPRLPSVVEVQLAAPRGAMMPGDGFAFWGVYVAQPCRSLLCGGVLGPGVPCPGPEPGLWHAGCRGL